MSKKRELYNLLIMAAIFVITLFLVFKGEDLESMMGYIQSANMYYLIPAVGFVVAYVLIESGIITYMLRSLGHKVKSTHGLLYSFIGYFFSCITPSASGGQPAQVYYMFKDGIPVATSTIVLLIAAITYKMVLVVVGLFVVIFRPGFLMKYLSPIMGWVYLGVFLNVAFIAFIMMLIFMPGITRKWTMGVVRWLGRKGVIKKEKQDYYIDRFENIMNQYADVSVYFKNNKKVVRNVFLITVVQRFLMFSVTYLVYRSLGLYGTDYFTIVMLQATISVAVDMLPSPGGMGFSESFFLQIFRPICGTATLPAMVLSRGLSYYTELLLSAVMTEVGQMVLGRGKNISIKNMTDPVEGEDLVRITNAQQAAEAQEKTESAQEKAQNGQAEEAGTGRPHILHRFGRRAGKAEKN